MLCMQIILGIIKKYRRHYGMCKKGKVSFNPYICKLT